FALTACGVLGMKLGATCLLIPNPRDIPSLIKDLAKYPVACLPAVNTLFSALLNHPDFGTISWSNLRCAMGGGMALQRPVAEAWKRATCQPIIEAYGLSETSPGLTINRHDITDYTGTIGLPLPSTDSAIRESNDVDMPLGEAGEICA